MRQLLSVLIHPCMLFNLDKYENQTAKSDSIHTYVGMYYLYLTKAFMLQGVILLTTDLVTGF